jgi:hypothetical protein
MSREIISDYCETHVTHINTLYEENAEFLNIRADGTYSYSNYCLKGLKQAVQLQFYVSVDNDQSLAVTW